MPQAPQVSSSRAAITSNNATLCSVFICTYCIALHCIAFCIMFIMQYCGAMRILCSLLFSRWNDRPCVQPPPPVTNVFPLCFICLLCHHSTSHHYAIFIVMVRTHEHSTTVITTNLCSWNFTAVRHTLTTLKLWNVVKSIFSKVSIILPTALIEGWEVWDCYATPTTIPNTEHLDLFQN